MNRIDIAWNDIQARYDQLSNELSSSSIEASKRHQVQKELSFLTNLLNRNNEIKKIEFKITEAQLQKESTTDVELRLLYDEEISRTLLRCGNC